MSLGVRLVIGGLVTFFGLLTGSAMHQADRQWKAARTACHCDCALIVDAVREDIAPVLVSPERIAAASRLAYSVVVCPVDPARATAIADAARRIQEARAGGR